MDRTKAPTLYSSHTTMFRVERRWQLHVWELKGAPATWESQLQARLAAEPVFAVISGLGGAHWEPVQRFCEKAALPCLFPNVEAPTGHDSDFYTVYFSRGVLLEAELIARELADAGTRVLTGYYPRLTLAPGQRFASKGGYIVRFTDPQGSRLTALGDWITP